MTITEQIQKLARNLGPPLLRIHVSEPSWRELFEKLTFDKEVHRALYGIPIIVDTAYPETWWSEHYTEKVILHMGDEVREITNFADFMTARWGALPDPGEVIESLDAIDGLDLNKQDE